MFYFLSRKSVQISKSDSVDETDEGSSSCDSNERISNIITDTDDKLLSSNNDNALVELVDLKTVATLGIGGFGRVNLVKRFDNDKVFALKILNKAHVLEMNQQEHVLNERNILISCRSDFIVR